MRTFRGLGLPSPSPNARVERQFVGASSARRSSRRRRAALGVEQEKLSFDRCGQAARRPGREGAEERAALRNPVEAALEAVVQTESQLGALTEAKVVDAGGVGFLLIMDALRAASLGEELQDELLDGLHGYDVQAPHIHNGMPAEGVEVMCTINLSPLEAATLRLHLDEVGDSVIMSAVTEVEEGYRWRVHVHVPEAALALRYIEEAGQPSHIAVTQLAGAGAVSPQEPGYFEQQDRYGS